MRTALEWASTTFAQDDLLRLVSALGPYWHARGHGREAAGLVRPGLDGGPDRAGRAACSSPVGVRVSGDLHAGHRVRHRASRGRARARRTRRRPPHGRPVHGQPRHAPTVVRSRRRPADLARGRRARRGPRRHLVPDRLPAEGRLQRLLPRSLAGGDRRQHRGRATRFLDRQPALPLLQRPPLRHCRVAARQLGGGQATPAKSARCRTRARRADDDRIARDAALLDRAPDLGTRRPRRASVPRCRTSLGEKLAESMVGALLSCVEALTIVDAGDPETAAAIAEPVCDAC